MNPMSNLYDLLRTVIAAGVDAKTEEAADSLEYAGASILDAIRAETKHVRAELDDASDEVNRWFEEVRRLSGLTRRSEKGRPEKFEDES